MLATVPQLKGTCARAGVLAGRCVEYVGAFRLARAAHLARHSVWRVLSHPCLCKFDLTHVRTRTHAHTLARAHTHPVTNPTTCTHTHALAHTHTAPNSTTCTRTPHQPTTTTTTTLTLTLRSWMKSLTSSAAFRGLLTSARLRGAGARCVPGGGPNRRPWSPGLPPCPPHGAGAGCGAGCALAPVPAAPPAPCKPLSRRHNRLAGCCVWCGMAARRC